MDFPVSCILLLLFIMAIIMIPFTSYAEPLEKIHLGSFLVANSSNSTWKSHSGEFAFGFRRVSFEKKGYLLAIMFDKMPERTIVWSANGAHLVEEGSTVQLYSDRFELLDSGKQRIWAVKASGADVAYGAMLDNGNFLLAGSNKIVVWRSFDWPTDTLLPGQILTQNGSLFAQFSKTNYSRGRFKLIMQGDGNVVLYTLNHPLTDPMAPYWASDTYKSEGYQVIFSRSGYIYLAYKNGTVHKNISSNEVSTSHYHQRLTLDPDGVLTHYVLRKSTNSSGGRPWSVNYMIPDNICTNVRGFWGGGACGFNSVCSVGSDLRPNCSCPEGYTLVDPTDTIGGCKPGFVQHDCNGNSMESDGFTLVDMVSTDWLNSGYLYYESFSEEQCRDSCLGDCLCHAAVSRERHCWKMGFPLRNGMTDPTIRGKSMMKIRTRSRNN